MIVPIVEDEIEVNSNNKTFPLPDKTSGGFEKRKFYSTNGGGNFGPMPVFSTAERFK